MEQRRVSRCHDVLSARQQRAQLINDFVAGAPGNRREVGHAIGVQGEEVLEAVGSRDTDGRFADQLSGIPTDLLSAVH